MVAILSPMGNMVPVNHLNLYNSLRVLFWNYVTQVQNYPFYTIIIDGVFRVITFLTVAICFQDKPTLIFVDDHKTELYTTLWKKSLDVMGNQISRVLPQKGHQGFNTVHRLLDLRARDPRKFHLLILVRDRCFIDTPHVSGAPYGKKCWKPDHSKLATEKTNLLSSRLHLNQKLLLWSLKSMTIRRSASSRN